MKKKKKIIKAEKAFVNSILETAKNRCSGKERENSYVTNKNLIDMAKRNNVQLGLLESKLKDMSNY